ncbi:30S ribosomal protein S3, partial [Candidatus Parcubacteria bacterium]|nr:30S ribosomal protein S3 [Candidatus Parcubacteria bacterium]
NTIYGVIGIKVWIYKGEYFDKKAKTATKKKPVMKSAKLFAEGGLGAQPVAKPPIKKEAKSKK